jgi:hypothetical protein
MNNKLKKTMFFTAGTWVAEAHPELLNIPEVHYLTKQLEHAQNALLERLEKEMKQ